MDDTNALAKIEDTDDLKSIEWLNSEYANIEGNIELLRNVFYDTLQRTIRLGKELLKWKKEIGYGGWTKWIKDNLDFRYEKAKECMDLAEEEAALFGHVQNLHSIEQALEFIGKPRRKKLKPQTTTVDVPSVQVEAVDINDDVQSAAWFNEQHRLVMRDMKRTKWIRARIKEAEEHPEKLDDPAWMSLSHKDLSDEKVDAIELSDDEFTEMLFAGTGIDPSTINYDEFEDEDEYADEQLQEIATAVEESGYTLEEMLRDLALEHGQEWLERKRRRK